MKTPLSCTGYLIRIRTVWLMSKQHEPTTLVLAMKSLLEDYFTTCSTGYSHQQSEPVSIMDHSSERRIRIGAYLVNEYTHVGLQHASFIQQVRSHARENSNQLF